tara:strand:+ start:406 stop:807 length:402 start_codon:yes stop_codon:yes gene_type:complete
MEIWNLSLWFLVGVIALIIGYSSLKNNLKLDNPIVQEKAPRNKIEEILQAPYEPSIEPNKSENHVPVLASLLDNSEEEKQEDQNKPKKVKKKSKPKTVNIECPDCNQKMEVPKLEGPQIVMCDNCGLSGEFEL